MDIAQSAISLLKDLIATPSFSREEDRTAELILRYLENNGVKAFRKQNNIWAKNLHFDPGLPVVLLNSHHDTVKPSGKWTRDPFAPDVLDDKLYGLGSNDAGGALTSLIGVFLHFYKKEDLPFNLILAATAEEEISGKQGVEALLPELGPIDVGIVGEPTLMQMAIAEKGLMVLDCEAEGKSGHAAREEGQNAIYAALADVEWFRTFRFPEKSEWLGEVKMTVTQIQAGSQHNVVPDSCRFVVDVRTTEKYTNQETYDTIASHVSCKVKPRSLRLNSSGISTDHPLVKRGKALGLNMYGSPTLSDQALMDFPTLKIGPGDSARSHTADEFIYLREISQGIELYISLLAGLKLK